MDSEDLSSAPDAPQPALSGPGASLRAAREAKRLELAHIAAETRIPLRHLEAIEADHFESLPSRTYAIGFARNYAKAVGLDDAAIAEAVRAELADGSMRRTVPSAAMEPGDPARLPSAGLSWAAAGAVLILSLGIFAFAGSYFGAGTGPGSLLAPEPAASASAAPGQAPAAPPVPTSGPVVLTALEDGIWVRLYEEGGERLTERTLKLGETIEVPVAAKDPRINTGRPDALSVTIGGQAVAKLSETPVTVSGLPVSAAALIGRTVDPAPTPAATTASAASAPRPPRRRQSSPASTSDAAAEAGNGAAPAPVAAPTNDPAPAAQPAAPAGR